MIKRVCLLLAAIIYITHKELSPTYLTVNLFLLIVRCFLSSMLHNVLRLYFREQSIKKVYVGGIPYYSSEDDIRSFFESCGSITEIDCMTFPESGKFRGIAILTFKVSF